MLLLGESTLQAPLKHEKLHLCHQLGSVTILTKELVHKDFTLLPSTTRFCSSSKRCGRGILESNCCSFASKDFPSMYWETSRLLLLYRSKRHRTVLSDSRRREVKARTMPPRKKHEHNSNVANGNAECLIGGKWSKCCPIRSEDQLHCSWRSIPIGSVILNEWRPIGRRNWGSRFQLAWPSSLFLDWPPLATPRFGLPSDKIRAPPVSDKIRPIRYRSSLDLVL